MTTILSSSTSQISPANERAYHQSNLLGDWKGSITKPYQPVEFKVINIRGNTAQVEYTHNGRTERGLADVNGATITFGNVTIGTRNGTQAAFEFSVGTAKMSAILNKQTSTTDQNKLIGSWSGFSSQNEQSALFQVVSVNGTEAQVKYTVNGSTHQGNGTVYKNIVTSGNAQISSNDGKTGTVTFRVGLKTYAVPVTKAQPPSSSSSSSLLNKLA